MKKVLLLLILVTGSIYYANCQTTKVKYQGDFQLGYSYSIGTFREDNLNTLNMHLVNGIRISPGFSIGIGFGIDYYYYFAEYRPHPYTPNVVLPLFLNMKGYFPVGNKTDLFLSFDLGPSFGRTYGGEGLNGSFFTPSMGVKFNVFSASVGYNYQKFSGENIYREKIKALQLMIGVTF